MDTKSLLAEAKARFSHNSAKHLLQEKYSNKLLVAEQNGLWKADQKTISFLNSLSSETVILIDLYNNPVQVNRTELLEKLIQTYHTIMDQWYTEYKELENKR